MGGPARMEVENPRRIARHTCLPVNACAMDPKTVRGSNDDPWTTQRKARRTARSVFHLAPSIYCMRAVILIP